MSQSEQREEAIFEAALKLPANQRAAYLDQTCTGDPDLRRRVEVLLGAFERAGGFMKQPATPISSRTVAVSLPPTEKPGDRIGRYKLFEQIGEGGCGVVYMAEQMEPVRRRVAFKVIKLGMDTKQVIARFEAERQALALMDHPNIAKVLDAGTTDTGRPYFVMELVKGIRITDYCDQNHLSTEERLGLFTQVCQAIQHAHQKGIIHRDIKPSNILVTLHDGVPVPKVIDFGIAKATEQPLTEKTVFTAFGQFMGTPAYMSPEQAELSGLDIDTRSDIYALGVLLYELLISRTPFDAKELLQAGLDEMRRRIREDEPMRPSTRLSTMADADLTEVAQQRHSEPAKLTRFIRGDLDWIVMKCLEKDRTRRYETANGLAADIRRHLENEPVVACPPSAAYRFQKLVRRNRLAVAAVSAVAAALVIGLGIAAWQFFEKSKAFNRAVAAEKKAQTEAAKSHQVAKFLKEMLDSAGPSIANGRDATVLREMLEKTSARMSRELQDQPEVQAEIYSTIGSTFMDMGDHRRAITNFEQAVRSYRLAFQGDDRNLAYTLSALGFCQSFTEDVTHGSNNAVLGVEMARKCGDKESLFICLIHYASSFEAWGMTQPEAEPIVREALKLKQEMGDDPVGLATAMGLLSGIMTNTEVAEQLSRNSLELFRKHLPPEHPETVLALFSLGQRLINNDKLEEAEEKLREAFGLYCKVQGRDHPYTPIVLRILGDTLEKQGKLTEVEALYRDALSGGEHSRLNSEAHTLLSQILIKQNKLREARELTEEFDARTKAALETQLQLGSNDLPMLIQTLNGAVDAMSKQGEYSEAERFLQRSLDLQRTLHGSNAVPVLNSLGWMADIRLKAGKPSEAALVLQEKLDIQIEALGPEHTNVLSTMEWLADIYESCSQWSRAQALRDKLLAAHKTNLGNSHPKTIRDLAKLSSLLAKQGRLAEADASIREVLAFLGASPINESLEFVGSLETVAGALRDQHRFSDAERLYQEALKLRRKFDAMDNPESIGTLESLAEVLSDQGKSEAATTYREALELRQRLNGRENSGSVWPVYHLATFLRDQGEVAESEKHYLEALALMKKVLGPEDRGVPVILNTLANMLAKQGRLPEAEKLHREAAEAARKLPPGKDHDEFLEWSLGDLGKMLKQQGKLDEAEAFYRQALEVSIKFLTNNPFKTEVNVAALVDIFRLKGRSGDAEKLFGEVLTPDVLNLPQSAGLLQARSDFYARRGQWKEAATETAKVLESDPSNHFPFHLLAPLLVASGDVEGYRRHCERIQVQFAGTQDPITAERMAKACLILPGVVADFQKINQWVSIAMTADTNTSLFQYSQLVSGLAAYRQTNYAQALENMQGVLSKPGDDSNPEVAAWTVIAMARQGLNRTNEARTALSTGLEMARDKLTKIESGNLGNWNDWIITHALLREARGLIEVRVNPAAEK